MSKSRAGRRYCGLGLRRFTGFLGQCGVGRPCPVSACHRVAARQTGVPPPYWGLFFFRARGLRLRRHCVRRIRVETRGRATEACAALERDFAARRAGRGRRGARHRQRHRPSARRASPPLNGASRSRGERASPTKSALRRHKPRSVHHLWRYIFLHKNALSRSVVAPWSLGPASYHRPVAARRQPMNLCGTAAPPTSPCGTAALGCGGRGGRGAETPRLQE